MPFSANALISSSSSGAFAFHSHPLMGSKTRLMTPNRSSHATSTNVSPLSLASTTGVLTANAEATGDRKVGGSGGAEEAGLVERAS